MPIHIHAIEKKESVASSFPEILMRETVRVSGKSMFLRFIQSSKFIPYYFLCLFFIQESSIQDIFQYAR